MRTPITEPRFVQGARASYRLLHSAIHALCFLQNGLTALHLCAQEDFIRVASILVKNGANVESETETGYRPIHVAAHFGNLSMIRFLLKHNAQIDVRTDQNYTPLHQAAQQGHAHIVSALLEANASHNARTNVSRLTCILRTYLRCDFWSKLNLFAGRFDRVECSSKVRIHIRYGSVEGLVLRHVDTRQ